MLGNPINGNVRLSSLLLNRLICIVAVEHKVAVPDKILVVPSRRPLFPCNTFYIVFLFVVNGSYLQIVGSLLSSLRLNT